MTDTMDSTGVSLKALFDVAVKLGSDVEEMKSSLKEMRRLQREVPVRIKIVGSVVATTGQPAILRFTQFGPDAGYYWEVNNFVIGGTDVNVAAAGNFGLYVGQQASVGQNPGLTQLVDGASDTTGTVETMPYTQRYGRDQIWVQDGEGMFAVVYGGTNLQTYVAVAQVTVRPTGFGAGRSALTD